MENQTPEPQQIQPNPQPTVTGLPGQAPPTTQPVVSSGDSSPNIVPSVAAVPQPVVLNATVPSPSPVVANPAPAQPVVTTPVATGHPSVIYGQNSGPKGFGAHLRWGVIIGGGTALVFIIALLLYALVLPTTWAKAYTKNIKTPYQTQASQLSEVYASLERPIFTDVNSTQTNDDQDLQYMSGILQTATENTNALKAKNNLTVLPGTAWLHSVSTANDQYQAMQQYVSDSQTMLQNYTTLVTYLQQTRKIIPVQLPIMSADFTAIGQSNDQASLTTSLQKAASDIESFKSQLKALKAPDDLNGLNQDLLTNLGDMSDALSAVSSDIATNNTSDIQRQLAVYVSSLTGLGDAFNSSSFSDIPTDSTLHSQVTNLQAEKPLN